MVTNNRKMTDTDKKELTALLMSGESIQSVANRTGWAYKTIQRLANRGRGRPWSAIDEQRLVDALRDGSLWATIGRMLHRSTNACQVHYNEMLDRTAGTDAQAKILMNDKYGNQRRAKSAVPATPQYVDPGDIYGLWCRAMDVVRARGA